MLRCQLRDNHAMSAAGTTDVAVLKPERVDVQAAGVHAHAGNEELVFNLK